MSKHVFFGKFCIEQVDGTDEYRVSAMPMSDKERDALAGIVRCRDCKHSLLHGTECRRFAAYEPIAGGDEYEEMTYSVSPDGYCAWGKRKEETE